MWRTNPACFWGVSICTSLLSVWSSLWAFSSIPTPFFCSSPTDPCSCTGGGFDIYDKFCEAAQASDLEGGENATQTASKNLTATKASARAAYATIFEAVGTNLEAIFISIGIIVLTILVFAVARLLQMVDEANQEKVAAEARELKLVMHTAKVQNEVGFEPSES